MTAVATAPTLPDVSDAARMAAAERDVTRFVNAVSRIPVLSRFQSSETSSASAALALPAIDEAALARRHAAALPISREVVERLKGIEDVVERVVAAQIYLGAIDVRAERIRYDRDVLGLLVMLAPWYGAQRRYRLDKAKLDDDLANGLVNHAQYDDRLEQIETTRRIESAKVKWRPTPAANLTGVSRGLLASRVAPRANADGPHEGDITVTDAEDTAAHTGSLVKLLDMLRIDVETVRNGAIDTILAGPPRGLGWSNAALARLLGITTARVAQLRTGSR